MPLSTQSSAKSSARSDAKPFPHAKVLWRKDPMGYTEFFLDTDGHLDPQDFSKGSRTQTLSGLTAATFKFAPSPDYLAQTAKFAVDNSEVVKSFCPKNSVTSQCPDTPFTFTEVPSRHELMKLCHENGRKKADLVYGFLTSKYSSNQHSGEPFHSQDWLGVPSSELGADGRITKEEIDGLEGAGVLVDLQTERSDLGDQAWDIVRC